MRIHPSRGRFAPVAILPAVLFAVLLGGCNPYTTPGAPAAGGGGGAPTGKLYVAGANTISRFDGASAATGNVAPVAVIRGILTGLNSTRFVLLDVIANRLYVANFGGNSILIFNEIGTKTGNVAPDRTIAGAATTLNGPLDVALDAARNLLYVSNATANAILVFDNAATVNGNVAPVRTITGSNTGLNVNNGLLLDPLNNRLYIANLDGNSVIVFDSASTQSGNAPPARTLTGASTQLLKPIISASICWAT